MSELNYIYIIPCIVGILLSIVILTRMRLFSASGTFFRTIDDADKDKGVVEIGGIAIFPILLFSLCISLGLPKWFGFDSLSSSEVERSGLRIMQVVAGAALLYIVGLKNDLHGTSSKVKLISLFCAACMLCLSW